MVGSRPTIGALEHLLEKTLQLGRCDMVADIASGILNSIVFQTGVDLLLQWDDSAGQPIGPHADSGQPESFELDDFLSQS
jgi:hypothetical protein